MSCKENWDDTRRRWSAYWHGEIVDRPVMAVYAPRPDGPALPPEPASPEEKWTSIDYQTRLSEALNLRTWHLGEAIPATTGPQAAWCAYYGGPLAYRPEAIWMRPFLDDWEHAPDWDRDWDDWGWRLVKKMITAFCEARKGRYWTGFPPLLHTAPNDMLALMRGTERFMIDLLEAPEEVEHALAVMRRNHARMYDELWDLIHSYGYEGWSHWGSVWCPERLGAWQSDISCMLSPAQFERFIVPELEENCRIARWSWYHLDGPGAIRHVERICAIPGIHTIQWVPGSGQKPGALPWMDFFRRVQACGRSLHIGFEPGELEELIRSLDPRRLFLVTGTPTREAGERLLADAVKWTARYWGKRFT